MEGFNTKNRRLKVGILVPNFRKYPDTGADRAKDKAVSSERGGESTRPESLERPWFDPTTPRNKLVKGVPAPPGVVRME